MYIRKANFRDERQWPFCQQLRQWQPKDVLSDILLRCLCCWVDLSLSLSFFLSLSLPLFPFVVYLWNSLEKCQATSVWKSKRSSRCNRRNMCCIRAILFTGRILWHFSQSVFIGFLSLCDFIASFHLDWLSNAICLWMTKYLLFFIHSSANSIGQSVWGKLNGHRQDIVEFCDGWNFEHFTINRSQWIDDNVISLRFILRNEFSGLYDVAKQILMCWFIIFRAPLCPQRIIWCHMKSFIFH